MNIRPYGTYDYPIEAVKKRRQVESVGEIEKEKKISHKDYCCKCSKVIHEHELSYVEDDKIYCEVCWEFKKK